MGACSCTAAQSAVIPGLRQGEEALGQQPSLLRSSRDAAVPEVHPSVLPKRCQAPAAPIAAACSAAGAGASNSAAAVLARAAAAWRYAARPLLPMPCQRCAHGLLRAAACLCMLLLRPAILLEGWAVAAGPAAGQSRRTTLGCRLQAGGGHARLRGWASTCVLHRTSAGLAEANTQPADALPRCCSRAPAVEGHSL